jgi:putative intracellular protease/amidase
VPKVLIIVSAADQITLADGKPHETGFWAEELYKPIRIFQKAGVTPVIATPGGKVPHADSYGLEGKFNYPDEDKDFLAAIARTFADDPEHIRLTLQHLTDQNLIAANRIHKALVKAGLPTEEAFDSVAAAAKEAWRNGLDLVDVAAQDSKITKKLQKKALRALAEEAAAAGQSESQAMRDAFATWDVVRTPRDLAKITDAEAVTFDAVFFPGGHGPMVDLKGNADVARILAAFHARAKPIAALCHGPAALLAAGDINADGGWMFEGYRLTSFTDIEELQTKPGQVGMPWLLESELKNRGAVFDDAPAAWVSHVVVDRNLITAQNPASAEAAAHAVLRALGVKENKAA